MVNVTKILIGIQARSTSSRFPGKCFEMLGNKMLLQHVIDAGIGSAKYVNRNTHKHSITTEVALLIPKGDKIKNVFKTKYYEGSETDVLSRYYFAALASRADYIVRVTGDCPLLPYPIITNHINVITNNDYDYVSNVDEHARTCQDGLDCEIFTFDLLEKAHNLATSPGDREHVTLWMRRQPKEDVKQGHVIGHFYSFSGEKLSVDTKEDLDRIRSNYERLNACLSAAIEKSGENNVHRF